MRLKNRQMIQQCPDVGVGFGDVNRQRLVRDRRRYGGSHRNPMVVERADGHATAVPRRTCYWFSNEASVTNSG